MRESAQIATQPKNKMHLRYNMMTADLSCNEHRHPQLVMREMGIAYRNSTPQSIADQWWFWDCVVVPAELPKFLAPLDLDPRKFGA